MPCWAQPCSSRRVVFVFCEIVCSIIGTRPRRHVVIIIAIRQQAYTNDECKVLTMRACIGSAIVVSFGAMRAIQSTNPIGNRQPLSILIIHSVLFLWAFVVGFGFYRYRRQRYNELSGISRFSELLLLFLVNTNRNRTILSATAAAINPWAKQKLRLQHIHREPERRTYVIGSLLLLLFRPELVLTNAERGVVLFSN